MYYTGIGSRSCPLGLKKTFAEIASRLEERGYILRSGGAEGADSFFEAGVKNPANKRIYRPWGYNLPPGHILAPSLENWKQAMNLAEHYHPAWERLSQAGQKLMARNSFQVLGESLQEPSCFVICWTPGGEIKGGTSQAIRIARDRNIQIFNLGSDRGINDWNLYVATSLFKEENQ